MTRVRASHVAVAVAIAAALGVSASARAATPAPAPAQGAAPASPAVPATLDHLDVVPENITGALAEGVGRQYLTGVRLYSVRGDNKQLWATLQVGTFNAAANPSSPDFLRSVADDVGGSESIVLRAGGTEVYAKEYHQLEVLVWFRGRDMFVLSVSNTYSAPKSLLLAALAALQ